MALEPYDLYKKIGEAFAKARENNSSPLPDFRDDNVQRGTGYAMALAQKSKDGDALAMHYEALTEVSVCGGMETFERDKGVSEGLSANCWKKVKNNLEQAYSKGVIRSATALATLYAEGWGVPRSKYLAAEWHLRAANGYQKNGSRNAAVLEMERAEALAPDHPEVMKVKQHLLTGQGR